MTKRALLTAALAVALVFAPTGAGVAFADDLDPVDCIDDVTQEAIPDCVITPPAPVDADGNCVDDNTGVAIDGCTVYVPPVETPVEQPPAEEFDESDDAVVPPPVVVVTPTPTPTPTPTATAAPAPAGWSVPLYSGQFDGSANSIAILALTASVVLAFIIGVVMLIVRVRTLGRRRRPAVRSVGVMSAEEAMAGVLPAVTPEFTAFDRQVLGYETPDKTTI